LVGHASACPPRSMGCVIIRSSCFPMKPYYLAVFACFAAAPLCQPASDLETFERNAARARQLGATHVVITEDLPPALWEMDVPGDPYPAWYMYHPGLLKIFPPAALEKYRAKWHEEPTTPLGGSP